MRTRGPITPKRHLAIMFAACLVAAWAFAPSASAQVQAGDILVVDPDVPPISTAALFGVDPVTGARTVLSTFGPTNPTAVAVEADGGILVTDTDAGTDPSGGTSEWGVLYRLSPDPSTGQLTRSVLTDFGVGPNTGRTPRAVTVEPDGRILVIMATIGTSSRGLLVRVDPVTGARAIVSDFANSGQGDLGVEPRGVAVEASGAIVVIDAQAGQGETGNAQGVLFRIDPQTGLRTAVSNFGVGASQGSNPTSLAVQASGQIVVTDEGHPSTTPLGLLFGVDPLTGLRTTLSDFNTGPNTGREPEGVALERDGQILVVDKHAGPLTRGMLFRVDPQTGARTIVSDFAVGPNGGGDPLALAVVPPTHGTLIVIHEVVNDNGGTAAASDWTLLVNGGNPSPTSFPGAGPPGTTVALEPGAYSVLSVRSVLGYAISPSSVGCGGTIAAGETKTCMLIHDDLPASLRVVNEVVNDDGGTAQASDWAMTVTGSNPAPSGFPGEGGPGTTVTLDAGMYAVAGTGPTGYTQTPSPGCTGTVAIGETRTCTITNDDRPGTLVVVVEMVNDNGGTATASDATIRVRQRFTGVLLASFPGEGAPGTTATISAGPYAVEVTFPGGYDATLSAACAGTMAIGETKTCTITLDDVRAFLLVGSKVVNDDGGTAVAGDFTVTVTGADPSPSTFPGREFPPALVRLDAGAYSVSVSGPPGYTSTLSAGCAGTLGVGGGQDCQITSDDQPATLVVVNEVVNHDGGTAQPSDWTMTVTGTNPVPPSFPGAASPGTTVAVDPGAYSVSAGGPAGYGSTASADCIGTIALGQTKTCTISHEDQSALLRVDVDVVNDNGGTAAASDWTFTVLGQNPIPATFPGSAQTNVTLFAGAYSVSQSGPAGYSSTLSPGCSGTIAPGETATCIASFDDLPPAVPACDGKPATIVAAPGQAVVQGTPGDDVIVALVGSHSVRGRDGDDTICTGPGADLVEGGAGRDRIIDAGGKNTVRGDGGNDTIVTGSGSDEIAGGNGNDTVYAGGGDDQVDGGSGRDTITTGAGSDRIDAGAGSDTVNAGGGDNRVSGQDGDDRLIAGAGNDWINGQRGFDVCTPGAGSNTVIACEAIT